LCISCGHCYAVCPQHAIQVSGFEDISTTALSQQAKVDSTAMVQLLRLRRSERLYKARALSREHIEALLEAASVAPSSENTRSVKAYVYTDENILTHIAEATANYYRQLVKLFKVPGLSFFWRLSGHSVAQLEHFKKTFAYIKQRQDNPDRILHKAKTLLVFTVPRGEIGTVGDAWLAAENAVVYAETLGIGSCFNGLIASAAKHRNVKEVLGIPKHEKVVCALTFGYPKLHYVREAPRKPMETVWN
jgi:nitroreductase